MTPSKTEVCAKAAFAVWVGIWLVLPGCLCQVLLGFGIEIHGHHHVAASKGTPKAPAAVAPASGEGLTEIGCHCDEAGTKTAEPEADTFGELAISGGLFAAPVSVDRSGHRSPRPHFRGGERAPPPPPSTAGPASTRLLSGVFLL